MKDNKRERLPSLSWRDGERGGLKMKELRKRN